MDWKLKINFKKLSLEENHVWGNASLRSSSLGSISHMRVFISLFVFFFLDVKISGDNMAMQTVKYRQDQKMK